MRKPTAQLSSEVPSPHSGQIRILKNKKRFNVVSTGRRFGKTTMIFIILALTFSYNLTHKRYAPIAVVTPSLKNLVPVWNKFKKMFEAIITYTSEQYNYVTIQNKFNVEFWSIEQIETMRGRDYCLILIDETALLRGLKDIWNAIMFPTLNDWAGSAWFFSTPKGYNDFHSFYSYADRDYFKDTWASFRATFLDNPFNDPKEYELARLQSSADYFAQEYDAEFVSLGNNLFNRDDFEIIVPGNYKGEVVFQCRYWDIASSDKGDYTASTRLIVTDLPEFIISRPFRTKGKWGQIYPTIKRWMIAEASDGVSQVFETEGIGNIAWQIIMRDKDLAGIKRFPADRRYTQETKYDRAAAWALESQLNRVKIERNQETENILEELESFPYGTYDDYVDTISGGFLSVNYLFGGFANLKNNVTGTTDKAVQIEKKINDIILIHRDTYNKYSSILSKYKDVI